MRRNVRPTRRVPAPTEKRFLINETLPFLVYAAREGYGWVNVGTAPLALREQFRRATGKMPDFDVRDAAGTSGVVNVGEWVLVYRFMRQVGGDSRGRDCAYLAMSFFKAEVAAEINADVLLLEPAFKVPQKTPPDTIEYSGGKGISADWPEPGQSGSGQFNKGGSLAGACAAAARVTGGTLRVWRREPDDGGGARYEYRRVPTVEVVQAASPTPARPEAVPVPADSLAQGGSVGIRWQTVVLLVICAFLFGVLLGRMLP